MEWWVDLSAILRNLAIVAGGGFGLWLAWSRTRALNKQTLIGEGQADVDRRRQALELYLQFCENLDGEAVHDRIAALQGLIELALAYPDILLGPVSHVLTEYRTSPKADPELLESIVDPFLEEWSRPRQEEEPK